jgi:hypothetical protein
MPCADRVAMVDLGPMLPVSLPLTGLDAEAARGKPWRCAVVWQRR